MRLKKFQALLTSCALGISCTLPAFAGTESSGGGSAFSASGGITGGSLQPCFFLVDVTYDGPAPKVTRVDYSGCPAISTRQP